MYLFRAAGTYFNMVRTDLVSIYQFFAFTAPVVPFRQQMALQSVFEQKLLTSACWLSMMIYIILQIHFLIHENFIFFIIMLYYVFFLWNSCSILLIYSNMLVEKWFLSSTIFSLYCIGWFGFAIYNFEHMFGQTTRKLVKIALLILCISNKF